VSNQADYEIKMAKKSDAGTYICVVESNSVVSAAILSVAVHSPANNTAPPKFNHLFIKDDPNAYSSVVGSNKTLKSLDDAAPSPSSSPQTEDIRLPKVTIDSLLVKYTPGERVVLNCSVTGQPPIEFYWRSGRKDYIPRHVRSEKGSLIFEPISEEDAGAFFCVAYNIFGKTQERVELAVDETKPRKIFIECV